MSIDRPFANDDEGEPYVCHRCIAEPLLKKEIRRWGRVEDCHYCHTERLRAVSVTWLARRIDNVYRQLVRHGEEVPRVLEDSDNVDWVINGERPSQLIAEMIECADDRIAEDIVSQLSEDHGDAIYRDGDTDWYDDASDIYQIELPEDERFQEAWENFCKSLKHERRFFSETARSLLDEILGPIITDSTSILSKAIRTIGPDDADRFVYRGRLANDIDERKTIFAAPIAQLGAPPPRRATAGRMNSAGISVFYGSSDPVTCVAELRAPVGGSAVVAKFEIIRPLRLLDLTKLEKVQNALSRFHPKFFDTHDYAQFIRGFHREIKKPIIPGWEALEYLPTQVVAEYLWTRDDGAVDGLIFGSSQVTGETTNIVLFPQACLVEGADNEKRREVDDARIFAWGHNEEEAETREVVTFRPIVEQLPDVPEQNKEHGLVALLDYNAEEPATVIKPSLRFVIGGLRHVSVRAIVYDAQSFEIDFKEPNADDDLQL